MPLTKLEYRELLNKTSLEGKFPAINKTDEFSPYCLYLTKTGEKCAVGVLIPKEKFVKGMNVSGSVYGLLKKYPDAFEIPQDLSIDHMKSIQMIHDMMSRSGWNHEQFMQDVDKVLGV